MKGGCICESYDCRTLITDESELYKAKPNLFLHSCCAPCSTAVIEQLVKEYHITVYFYNPNVTDKDEYKRRRDAQYEFIKNFNANSGAQDKVYFLEGAYDREAFYHIAAGLEDEAEGGERCSKCFEFRLENAADQALIRSYETCATTLSISPHKNFMKIKSISSDITLRYGIEFLTDDFSRSFQRSVELSKMYKLYRQKYCGCEFSKR